MGQGGSGGKTRIEIRPQAHTHKARTSPRTRDWPTVNRAKAGDKGGLPDARKSLGHRKTREQKRHDGATCGHVRFAVSFNSAQWMWSGGGGPRPAWSAAVGVFLELGASLGEGWAKLCQTCSWVAVCMTECRELKNRRTSPEC